jgi:hypothetical protein
MQSASQSYAGKHRQQSRRPIPEANQLGQQKGEGDGSSNAGSDQREGPSSICEPPAATAVHRHEK